MLGTTDHLIGPVDALLRVDLYIAGCLPTPDTTADAILLLIDEPDRLA